MSGVRHSLRLRIEQVEFVNVEGEIVVLDKARSLYYSVNESAVRLWFALRDGTTEDALCRVLADANGLSDDKAAADVTAFLEQLDTAGLIERTPAP